MGHLIDREGRFQSDKYPELPRDKMILSFKDDKARRALWLYAALTDDIELADDIRQRISDFDP